MASLTIDQIKAIANFQKAEGRLHLAKYLGWQPFDEDSDLQMSILLDFHYDTLMFGIGKGFPLSHVHAILSLATDVQHESIGKPMVESIKLYKRLALEKLTVINDKNLKIFTEYFFGSFMKHYNLYQYVFAKKRSTQMSNVTLNVETVSEPLPLNEAKEAHIWDYEQKYKQLQEEEEKKMNDRSHKKTEFAANDQERLNKLNEDFNQIQTPVERQSLEAMIEELVKAHVTAATHNLTVTCEQTMDELQFKLDKTSLPRPQQLGVPPRYSTKTPIPHNKATDKSGKQPKSRENTSKSSKGRKA